MAFQTLTARLNSSDCEYSAFDREDFKSIDEFTALRFTATRCTAGREAHANFADESADNVWNEVVTIRRSQGVLKMPSSPHVDFFCN
jgi:hypothetical protein